MPGSGNRKEGNGSDREKFDPAVVATDLIPVFVRSQVVPADALLKVYVMFQKSRHLFHRRDTSVEPRVAASRRAEGLAPASEDRHPAMRGLNVSPVHGRHCICNRCSPDKRAA
jgi:hypothetical protein